MIPLNFYEKLTRLCTINKTSPSAVAKAVGLSNSSATYWKKGAIPKGDTVQKLAEYFHVPTDYFLSDEWSIPKDELEVQLKQLAQKHNFPLSDLRDMAVKKIFDRQQRMLMKSEEDFKSDEIAQIYDGILAFIESMYGQVQEKNILSLTNWMRPYYLVGPPEEQFILFTEDVSAIFEAVKAMIPPLVDRMRINRPECEVAEENLREMNTRPTPPNVSPVTPEEIAAMPDAVPVNGGAIIGDPDA